MVPLLDFQRESFSRGIFYSKVWKKFKNEIFADFLNFDNCQNLNRTIGVKMVSFDVEHTIECEKKYSVKIQRFKKLQGSHKVELTSPVGGLYISYGYI